MKDTCIERFFLFSATGNQQCTYHMNIPPKYGSTEKYFGTLGHKVNHNFEARNHFMAAETARYLFFKHYLYLITKLTEQYLKKTLEKMKIAKKKF